MKLFCVYNNNNKDAYNAYQDIKYNYDVTQNYNESDVIIVLGGDGLMLHTIHKYIDSNKPIYGINYGTVGFLMNNQLIDNENLIDRIKYAESNKLCMLKMVAHDINNNEKILYAFNEVSLFRSTPQAGKLMIKINDIVRMKEIICDGVLVCTPCGSTAYNLSVGGNVIPFDAQVMAITSISPFRPRNWKGALLSLDTSIEIVNIGSNNRNINAVADFSEIKDVKKVLISKSKDKYINIMFDENHSLEERIIKEQFLN